MPIRVKARGGESTSQMLRRFKKLCEKEGLTKDIKRKQYFEKPSERRRRAARKTVSRLARVESFKAGGGGQQGGSQSRTPSRGAPGRGRG